MLFFFFNDTATTEIYTLSLHDALPISLEVTARGFSLSLMPFDISERFRALVQGRRGAWIFTSATLCLGEEFGHFTGRLDRKSTRLNSSHSQISYAVFCLKKKNILLAASHIGCIARRLALRTPLRSIRAYLIG